MQVTVRHYSMASGNSETVSVMWAKEQIGSMVISGYEIQRARFRDRSGNRTVIIAVGWSEYLTNVFEFTHGEA